MSKLVKSLITDELQSRYTQMDSALWVEILGVDGITTNDFRRALHKKAMKLEVVKNALLRRACGEGPLAPLAKTLAGPAALITGGESVIEAAKVVEEWQPKMKGLRLRGALLEGQLIDEKMVQGLAKMPTKRDLQGQVAAAARSPGAKLASAILAPGGAIASCLKSLMEKLEKGGDAAPPPPAEAA